MDIFQAVLLGLIQGLTEFLPVSSSGHLVFVSKAFGIPNSIVFDVMVHLATALAVIYYFRKELWDIIKAFAAAVREISLEHKSAHKNYQESVPFRIGCLILLASVPTGFIGFTFKDFFETLFSSVFAVGIFLVLTGVVLWLAEYFSSGKRVITGINTVDALIVGTAQGLAIAPGLSRSGMTIATSLLRGIDRQVAAEFSFLLSIPAILGAGLIESRKIFQVGVVGGEFWPLFWGAIAAFISAYLAIKFFLQLIRKVSLVYFAYYCWVVGCLLILWQIVAR